MSIAGTTRTTDTEPAAWSDDPYADALRAGRGPLFLRRTDGWLLPLDVERWCSRADAADLSALHRCEGAVLDVGCGPGRLVAALAARGQRALGVDVSAAAVERTLRHGGTALRRSVFDPLPGEGRWGTVLLVDGNIGIGGDPAGLLRRAAGLLAHRGLIIAETAPVDIDERVHVRVDDGRRPRQGSGARTSRGPGSAPPPCSVTAGPSAGSPSISGRRRAAPSWPCAAAAPASPGRAPSTRTARP